MWTINPGHVANPGETRAGLPDHGRRVPSTPTFFGVAVGPGLYEWPVGANPVFALLGIWFYPGTRN